MVVLISHKYVCFHSQSNLKKIMPIIKYMGLNNLATTTLENGLEISNTYISVERLKIEKDVMAQPTKYRIYNRVMEHVSRDKKYESKPKISSVSINFDLEELPSTIEELYTKVYSEVKLFYPDAIDVIE